MCFCVFQGDFWDATQPGIKVVFERVRAMNMLLLRSAGLLFLLGSGAVLGIGNAVATWAYVIPHNDIALNNERKSGPLNGDAARQWYRAARRVGADADHVKAHGTSAPFWRTIRTLINNINATSTRLKTMESRIMKSTAHEQDDSSLSIESETEHSPQTNRHEVSSTLRDGKLDSSKPASLVPPSIIGRRDGNERPKRSAARSQERTNMHGRKKREMGGHLDAFAGQAIPRPLTAYNQTTDFPFNPTTYYDFFTFPDDDDDDDDDKWETTTKTPLNTIENTNKPTNPFYPIRQESLGAYAVAGVAVIVFAVGVFGNIAIMCIVCHNYYMRSISNSLLANLALWDFFILVFCLPLVVYQELTKDWLLGELSCKAVPYVEVVSLGVVTFTLCALCVDRFRAASNVQMHYETVENCSSTAAKLAVIWIGALLLALPELVIHQLVMAEEDGGGDRCVVQISPDLPDSAYVLGLTYQGARLWWHFGCYFCLPMFFTVVGSLATARKIRRAEKTCARGGRERVRIERDMNRAVLALAILYGLCVVPENARNAVSAYMAARVPPRAAGLLRLASRLLLISRAAATPVLLLCLCQPFGRAFRECCCCCFRRDSAPRGPSQENDLERTADLELEPTTSTQLQTPANDTAATGSNC